ncbi:MAG: hypothetical protein IPL16_07355 [Ignavibacteria bacterium]|nr:hypothetical protein [Ignavibacteria bacterium]
MREQVFTVYISLLITETAGYRLPNSQIIYSMYVNGNNVHWNGSGVYISSNNGANWTPSECTNEIYSICVTGGNIYAGVSICSRGYKSTNNGVPDFSE